MIRALACAVASIALACAAAQACPMAAGDGERLAGKAVSIAWRPDPSPIPVGRHFSLRLTACTSDARPFGGSLSIDATMPAHRHGMNYRATVRSEGNGSFVAEGLLFHMPGHWQIVIDVDSGRERLVTEVTVE